MKPSKSFLFLFAALATVSTPALALSGINTQSVDGSLTLSVDAAHDDYDRVSAALMSGDADLLDIFQFGIKTSARDFSRLKYVGTSGAQVTEVEYDMPTGKRSHCYNVSSDRSYSFVNPQGDSLRLDIKVFPDGVAFRYFIPYVAEGETVDAEYTTYSIPDGKSRWFQPYNLVYEDFYPLAKDGAQINKNQKSQWGYPALLQSNDSAFVLISESDVLRGHAGSLLSNADNPTKYLVTYGGGTQEIGLQGWTSPWRVLISGPLENIVSSTLITDVATPAVIDDTSWIKPAPVSWIYWANNHGSNDYDIIKSYIDLAVDMNWPYMLIDAEWDEMKDGKTVEDALDYAHSHGVRPLLWYNSSTGWIDGAPGPKYRLNKRDDRLAEYAWLKSHGVDGVKIDFFDGDKVQDMDYCIDLLEDALQSEIMVTLHGATIPRGWQRTYPNLMTVEAVYGAEWYNNKSTLTDRAAAHNATLPFTRNVIGPMDYTPGTFTDSQHPHITSHGHELALSFLFESPHQHMPDRPEAYAALPEEVRALLSTLPTAWDDTALLSGYPGHHAVIARQKGDDWYIAGINGTDDPLTLQFALPWPLDDYTATLYSDGQQQREFAPVVSYAVTERNASVDCLPRGGFVMVLKPTVK